jgi:phosphatidylglycerophosphate synthase
VTRALIIARGPHGERGTASLLGLQVAERIVANLQHRGVDEIIVAGSRLALPERRRDSVTFLEGPDDRDGEDGGATASAIREVLDGAPSDLLVVTADTVYHPDLPAQLVERAKEAGCSQVAEPVGQAGDPVLLLRPDDSAALPELGSMEQLATALVKRGAAQRQQSTDLFVVPAREDEERRRAARLLLKLNWRPHDGLVARYLNKYISVTISAWLADTPITPNQMTILAFLVAMVGVGVTTIGSYLAFVVGTLLVQIQSILDGCDGELARMRYQSSRVGGWLDTIADDVIGVFWILALGHGLYRGSGQGLYLVTGMGAALFHAISVGLIYTVLIRHGGVGYQDMTWWFEEKKDAGPRSDKDENEARSLLDWAKYLVRRDFYVLFYLAMALLNLMPVALLVACVGSTATLVITAIQISKRGFKIRPEPTKQPDPKLGTEAETEPAPVPQKDELDNKEDPPAIG